MNNRITCLLPKTMLPNEGAKRDFAFLGFSFKDVKEKNFHLATLPNGWKPVLTDDAQNILIDKKGRERAIFDYYQGFSWIRLYSRFYISCENECDHIFVRDRAANNKVVFCVGQYKDLNEKNRLTNDAQEYLDIHYPNWDDPTEYWD